MKKLVLASAAMFVVGLAASNAAAQPWVYKEIKDKFTDKIYSIATNKDVAFAPYDQFKVSFECRVGSDFVFTIDAIEDLGGRNEAFEFQYRADGEKAKKVRMRTFTNSSTGGMNTLDAVDIANDFLNADTLIVRAISAAGDYYDSEISLEGSVPVIIKAVKACGLNVER